VPDEWHRSRSRRAEAAVIDVLLFDLGGVLVEYSGVRDLASLLPDHPSEQDVRARWSRCQPTEAYCLGHLSRQQFGGRFVGDWGLTLSSEAFLDEFRSWPRRLFHGTTELLASLRSRYRIAILSNSNELHWERIMDDLGVAALCDVAISSHHVHLAKPDPRIFVATLERLAVRPETVMFFDDAIANVEAARTLGMRACHANGVDEVRAHLTTAGLL
jgi:putative hydrolase of the HAD superfamily